MARVPVRSAILQWAIDRAGQDRTTITERFPKLPEWEQGTAMPTLRQLEAFAKTTHTPLGFLFLDKPPEDRLPIPFFRTVTGPTPYRPSADLIETVQMMEIRQGWVRDYWIEEGREPLSHVRTLDTGTPTAKVVAAMRQLLSLPPGWAESEGDVTAARRVLARSLERVGVMVVVNGVVGNNTHRVLDPNEFRGFVLVDDVAPLVFVNGADALAAQIFTLAHEAVHLLFGQSGVFDLRELRPADDLVERACNQAAAEFLVPQDDLRHIWAQTEPDHRLSTLARRYKASRIVIARRALELGLWDHEAFLQFYRTYEQNRSGRSRQATGGDFYRSQNLRIGRLFADAVARATSEGQLSYLEAFRMTGLYGGAFHKVMDSLSRGR